ncbi:hypothetical protein DFH07DRAFT_767256 [Mycena maculata]|uniref:Uncharacterized protein n=1 Tax=Mycena maculata TaxID=230809 RepID=A0AAD7NTK3_9AGAR|nr:hypothetical protein DFH07DRAFT_767256 [Mycena maculata]
MAPTKSVCGEDLLLTDQYNYDTWRKQPEDINIPADMGLQEKNQYNYNAEMANHISISTTRAYETLVKSSGTPPAVTKDIGAKMKAYYKYTKEEVEDMVTSERFEQVVGPIPPTMLQFLIKERMTRAKKDEEKRKQEKDAKEKAPELAGSMVMSKAALIDPLTRSPVSIPVLFLAAIKYRQHPSLFWFTNDRLRYATENPGNMPTKKNIALAAGTEKSLLDCTKLEVVWGSDVTAEGFTIFEWTEASANFLEAVQILSAKPDPTNQYSYAVELEKHQKFFAALPDFNRLFEVWYPVELQMRNKILDTDARFEVGIWKDEASGTIRAWRIANGGPQIPTSLADLGPNTSRQGQASARHTILHEIDNRPPPTGPRNTDNHRYDNNRYGDNGRNVDNGWQGRDNRQGREGFRDFRDQDTGRERHPVT